MTIGQKIKRIRLKRGLTQSELGEKVSLTGDRIRQYENDVRCPKPEMLQIIADALNVNIRAISDPSFNDAASAIYALFELEDTFNFHLENHYFLHLHLHHHNSHLLQVHNLLFFLDLFF